LPLIGEKNDNRLIISLDITRRWQEGKATVGDARKATVNSHVPAQESLDTKKIIKK
jgi:hypothetical protein